MGRWNAAPRTPADLSSPPISAAGLTLVEFRCKGKDCGFRFWVDSNIEMKETSADHHLKLCEQTGHETHIRLADF